MEDTNKNIIEYISKDSLGEVFEEIKERIVKKYDAKIENVEEKLKQAGSVKTVNGNKPDENGNIEIELPKVFSGSWNELHDKPFYNNKTVYLNVEEDVTFAMGVSIMYEAKLPLDPSVLPTDTEFSYCLYANGEKVDDGSCFYMGYFEVVSNNNSSYSIHGFGSSSSYITVTNDAFTENTPVSLSLEFFIEDIKYIDESVIPSTIARTSQLPNDVLQYTEQDLTEDEKNQARKNLGLYYNYEQPIIEELFIYNTQGNFAVDKDELSAKLKQEKESYIVSFNDNLYNVTSNFEYTSDAGVGVVDALLWIGNPTLIETHYDLSNITENLDLPFVIYWKDDEFIFNDDTEITVKYSSDYPNYIVSMIPLSISQVTGQETVYETVPDEYIPNTITRTSDIITKANQNSLDTNYSPTNPSDLATKEYVDSNILTSDDAVVLLAEIGLVEPASNNGYVFTDKNNVIYTF